MSDLDFTLHDEASAPPDSKALLEDSRRVFGMIPNLHAVMAEAPGMLEGYKALHQLFLNTSFDEEEKTVVWQAVNVEHECHYCVPAHTAIAKRMNVSDTISDALRDRTPLPNARLEALRTFTLQVVRKRGRLDPANLQAFLEAGYTKRHILEVVLGVAQKVMSNYVNHITGTPLDRPFKAFEWD